MYNRLDSIPACDRRTDKHPKHPKPQNTPQPQNSPKPQNIPKPQNTPKPQTPQNPDISGMAERRFPKLLHVIDGRR